jgi:hypothetical protein
VDVRVRVIFRIDLLPRAHLATRSVGTDFPDAPAFQDWAPHIWLLLCQTYMAWSRAALGESTTRSYVFQTLTSRS